MLLSKLARMQPTEKRPEVVNILVSAMFSNFCLAEGKEGGGPKIVI